MCSLTSLISLLDLPRAPSLLAAVTLPLAILTWVLQGYSKRPQLDAGVLRGLDFLAGWKAMEGRWSGVGRGREWISSGP